MISFLFLLIVALLAVVSVVRAGEFTLSFRSAWGTDSHLIYVVMSDYDTVKEIRVVDAGVAAAAPQLFAPSTAGDRLFSLTQSTQGTWFQLQFRESLRQSAFIYVDSGRENRTLGPSVYAPGNSDITRFASMQYVQSMYSSPADDYMLIVNEAGVMARVAMNGSSLNATGDHRAHLDAILRNAVRVDGVESFKVRDVAKANQKADLYWLMLLNDLSPSTRRSVLFRPGSAVAIDLSASCNGQYALRGLAAIDDGRALYAQSEGVGDLFRVNVEDATCTLVLAGSTIEEALGGSKLHVDDHLNAFGSASGGGGGGGGSAMPPPSNAPLVTYSLAFVANEQSQVSVYQTRQQLIEVAFTSLESAGLLLAAGSSVVGVTQSVNSYTGARFFCFNGNGSSLYVLSIVDDGSTRFPWHLHEFERRSGGYEETSRRNKTLGPSLVNFYQYNKLASLLYHNEFVYVLTEAGVLVRVVVGNGTTVMAPMDATAHLAAILRTLRVDGVEQFRFIDFTTANDKGEFYFLVRVWYSDRVVDVVFEPGMAVARDLVACPAALSGLERVSAPINRFYVQEAGNGRLFEFDVTSFRCAEQATYGGASSSTLGVVANAIVSQPLHAFLASSAVTTTMATTTTTSTRASFWSSLFRTGGDGNRNGSDGIDATALAIFIVVLAILLICCVLGIVLVVVFVLKSRRRRSIAVAVAAPSARSSRHRSRSLSRHRSRQTMHTSRATSTRTSYAI